MGVPALFRWLSKKYPKIILPVVEEEETKIPDVEGTEIIVPVDISRPNPNEEEFDNLYLDMNGIVHPCTHPEGKPAPENEEEMMVEIFSYTERVVNMIRPRKLLFMAIDGVAPRAKMNQQRSRRFRSAQEAQDKEEARKEAVSLWEAMGKTMSEDEKSKKAWDSNAITPGTPFMDLLASSLRYWVARKMNTDPGWKQMEVIISDASVPGEGEHKIMDFIRRQRSNPGHDPNTRHVIYGLDADLIMLSLATHEPHFRVLREDVFFQEGSRTACRICGQEGHYAAQCTGTKADIQKKPPTEKKPFIFLDVAILREYLEAELQVSHTPFPFNLEQAIDDWVLLIFFVGNDFLPHLPSLEIREGAIDTLLKIWRDELPRMGGYLTNHGRVELTRAQIILEGLAKREDDIFRRRREAEERQDQNAKRRKIEKEMSSGIVGPSSALNLTATPTAPPGMSALSSLPARPLTNSFAAKADSIGLGGPKSFEAVQNAPTAAQALGGSNHDVVANRRAIRMANMSAAETLKAELAGLMPVKPSKTAPVSTVKAVSVLPSASIIEVPQSAPVITDELELPGLGSAVTLPPKPAAETKSNPISESNADHDMDADGDPDPDFAGNSMASDVADVEPRGVKRSLDDVNDAEETEDILVEDDDDAPPDVPVELALKVNPDGTVEQEDTVKLWEPGYQERYYRQKFGVEYSDAAFKKDVTTRYVEGLAWVLQYYYQGTPSWTWYYPYHFAPFAVDFQEVTKMDMTFNPGQPFKPFEQLMGVFPAASRMHIPEVFQSLMTDEDSPIIDFYPSTFQIDMNGKKMAWQGVALLPFIDEKRLLEAMASRYPNLTEEEIRRNRWGNNVIYVFEEHSLYPSLEALYGKRKNADPVPMSVTVSKGINGSLLPNPDCIPGSTIYCPLPGQGLPDIKSDRSLSAFYFFPKQLSPHRSVLLPGVRRQRPVLSESDKENARRGGRGRGRGGGGGYGGPPDRNGRGQYGGVSSYGDYGSSGRNRGGSDWQRPQRGSYNQSSYPPQNSYQQASSYSSYQSYQAPPSYQQNNGYSSRGAGPANHNGYGSNNPNSGRGRGGPRGGASDYNGGGYEGGGGRGYGGNSRGGYGDSRGGGYGGYGYGNSSSGGYGGPPQNGYGGYGGGPPRGGPPNGTPNRGRGRAGWY